MLGIKHNTHNTLLLSLYSTCDTITNEDPDRAFFFNSIAEVFAGLVQYAAVGELETECQKLINYEGNSLEKLAQYVVDDLNGNCLGTYDDFLALYASTNLTTGICKYVIP